ncbi:MAG TPA: DUF4105 domain-containing protein [Polyangiaceae bacterium]|nr:DUF4105 domain-containing protein [Polyangiaceae bacterium]
MTQRSERTKKEARILAAARTAHRPKQPFARLKTIVKRAAAAVLPLVLWARLARADAGTSGFAAVGAQARGGDAAPPARAGATDLGNGYRVSVLTMGPGDAFVTLFGHDALLVERAGLPPLVYNFGMYTEAAIAPHHVLGGTLRYYLEAATLPATLAVYRAENREVVRQTLDLEPARAERLARALSLNTLPENANYPYDFARDNCTTRVRDALDRALDGALRRALSGPAKLTYREHALRFTARDLPLYFLFDLGLGRPADRPLTAWDDAYLPDRLKSALRTVHLDGPSGSRPLVSSESVLEPARRAEVLSVPKVRAPWHAFVGLALGGALLALGAGARRAARIAFGVLGALLGLFVGLLGVCVLLLLGTHVHPATHQNYNALICPALALWLTVPASKVALGRAGAGAQLARASAVVAAVSVLGVVAAALAGQDSLRVALLLTPPLTALSIASRRALRTP